MKTRLLFAAAAVVTCSAGAAMAADLPRRSPPPMPYAVPPLFTWTGFYAGVNAGATFDNRAGLATPAGFNLASGNGFNNAPAIGTFGPFRGAGSDIGFTGGGQVGYNVQTGMFVYGLEADINYFNAGGGGSRTFADSNVYPGGSLTLKRRSDDGYLGTVRGRLGVAAFERTLLYVTGGLAYGNYGTSYGAARFTAANGVDHMDFNGGTSGDTRIGYALGAGVEYAFTPHISGKVEYLYTDLGSQNYQLHDNGLPIPSATTINVHEDGTAQLARVGLNYKF